MKIGIAFTTALLTIATAGAAYGSVKPQDLPVTETPTPTIPKFTAAPTPPPDGTPIIDTTQPVAKQQPDAGTITPKLATPGITIGATITQQANGWVRVSYNSHGQPCSGLNLEIGGNSWTAKETYNACTMTVDVNPQKFACQGSTEMWIQITQNESVVAGKYVIPATCPATTSQ
jgi:hypothetical protein